MKEQEQKMKLPKLDDLFTNQETRDNQEKEFIHEIPIDLIDNFPDHPFSVNDDELMDNIVESINNNGVIPPAIIRPKENGRYEMIAGHRRKRAFQKAKKEKMPCIIKKLTDDEATILMVDTNINQRQEILPSEKAFAYKMKLDAMKHQGTRNDLTSNPLEGKLETAEIIGNENNESASNIRRYIRLTYLIPELLELVNEKRIAFRPAVELSFLKKDEQKILFDIIQCMDCTPSLAQAIDMKKKSQINILTADEIDDIMSTEKANQITKLKINQERFEKVIPNKYVTAQQKEDYLYKCAEFVMKRKIKKLQQQQTR